MMDIYAELSKKQYDKILRCESELCLPHGVRVKNRCGSRGLFFECDSKEIAQELIDGLDASSISWQEN